MILTSFLNYNRSINLSEGMLFGLVGGREVPIQVHNQTVRGSISNYIDPNKALDPANPTKGLDPASANIQRIDTAFLPAEATTLVLHYSVVVHGGLLSPSGCDNGEVRTCLERIARKAAAKGGLAALADRYAWNIVNARGLWRNRLARDKVVAVTLGDDETLTFHSDTIPTFTYPGAEAMPGDFARLSGAIAHALTVRDEALFLRVRVSGELPPGAEVFPSQEFLEEDKSRSNKQGRQGRVLASRPVFFEGERVRQAVLHSQKLSNALRAIDDWHPQAETLGVLPVETYGYSQGSSKTVRMPKRASVDGPQGRDFYGLLKEADLLEAAIDAASGPLPDDVLYFLSVLIRGGVFSGPSREKSAA